MEILRVTHNTRSTALAGAIANILRERKTCQIKAIGQGASNIALKAIAHANNYLVGDQIVAIAILRFEVVQLEDEEKTGLKIDVEGRRA